MNYKYIAAILVTLLTIIIICLHWKGEEGFASKREKAQKIFDWFETNPEPNYNSYKKDLNGQSNIVEYEDILALFQNKNLTVDSVEKAI